MPSQKQKRPGKKLPGGKRRVSQPVPPAGPTDEPGNRARPKIRVPQAGADTSVPIGVTSFSRNPEVFETLQQEVLPKLMAQRCDDPIRCWVQGCSTGQEAYSVAISFRESVRKALRPRRLQIFATDINEKSLAKARIGLYAKTRAADAASIFF